MSGHGVNLDVTAGQAAASNIKGIIAEMRGVIGRIKSASIGGLGDWNGSAARTFNTTSTDWHGTAVQLEQALGAIENRLSVGFAGYDNSDAEAGQAIVSGAAGGGLNL